MTDNDRGSRFHIKSGSWLSADMFIDCKEVQVIMDGKEQKPYAPDNNSYGCDVYADEIVVKYTYETITIPATTVLVAIRLTYPERSVWMYIIMGYRDFQNFLYLE